MTCATRLMHVILYKTEHLAGNKVEFNWIMSHGTTGLGFY